MPKHIESKPKKPPSKKRVKRKINRALKPIGRKRKK